MASERLTKQVVDGLRPAEPREARKSRHGDAEPGKVTTPDRYVWDGGKGSVSGFGVKVTPKGAKSFVFQYRMRGAKTDRRYKIGRYGDWTVDLARERARELRLMVDRGIDPLDHDKASAKAAAKAKIMEVERAFNVISDRWFKIYKEEPRRGGAREGRKRSAATIRMVQGAVAYFDKRFGSEPIGEISEIEISAALDKIPAKQLATRRNVYAAMRLLWGWAHRQRLIEENPFDRIEAPVLPPSRARVLVDSELALIWRASRRIDYPFGPAYRVLLLSGQRRAEVFGMRWNELNQDAAEWCIPGDRTKNGLAHVVPITPAVAEELGPLCKGKRWPVKGLVFTTNGKSPSSGFSRAKARLDGEIATMCKEAGVEKLEPWRLHDFRRTVATGLQQLGVRLEVTEATLNHSSGSRSGIVGVYQRHQWSEEKREALGLWADKVKGLLKPKAAATEEKNSPGAAR